MPRDPNLRMQQPAASGLAALAALGVAHALWALFQWTQLVAARTGGQSFCGFGDAGGQACTAVWDSGFASTVQTYTALPVAGWGLVWSLVRWRRGYHLRFSPTGRSLVPETRSRDHQPSVLPQKFVRRISGISRPLTV